MKKTNRFHVKKIKDTQITVEEERKNRSPFILFFINNGKLIFTISLLFSLTIFLIAIGLTISNIQDSTVVEHVSNGVIVSFKDGDNSILNGTPITKEYANKVFDSQISDIKNYTGVVIKLKETPFNGGKIVFYSDKTALIKYKDGTYLRVFPVNNNYGVGEDGTINSAAFTKKLTGEIKSNTTLGIELLYLSDGSIEVTKDKTTIFVRNSDITNNSNTFYTNLSIISVPVKKENNKIYYSNGTIKDSGYITVNNTKYNKTEEIEIQDGIKIIYYENGFAEIIRGNLSIIVEKKEHIVYNKYILEIIDNTKDKDPIEIKDVMDINDITLKNTNKEKANYRIVLEETEDYTKHNVKRLDNTLVNYNIYLNGKTTSTEGLNNNIKDTPLAGGLSIKNNSYLLYEGELASDEEINIKLGLWISYESITNEYMNSAFIGTIKVYVESLS